jgi:hypothetical protein
MGLDGEEGLVLEAAVWNPSGVVIAARVWISVGVSSRPRVPADDGWDISRMLVRHS